MDKEDNPSYYANIPASVRYCKNVTANAKLLYGELTALSNKYGFCWATNSYFAKLYKKNKATISIWIRSLEDNGFIRCVIENNNKRKIYIKDGLEKSKGGFRKIERGGYEKSNGLYNTKRNNKKNSVVAKNHDELISLETPSFSSKCAQKLEGTIRAKRKIYRTVDQGKWTQHFFAFRIEHKIKKSRITKVLNWYIAHFGDNFVPVAYSAKTFCDKFFQIEDARNRYNKDVDEGRIAPKVVGRVIKHVRITSACQGYE